MPISRLCAKTVSVAGATTITPLGLALLSDAAFVGKSANTPPMYSGRAPFIIILLGKTVDVSEDSVALKADSDIQILLYRG